VRTTKTQRTQRKHDLWRVPVGADESSFASALLAEGLCRAFLRVLCVFVVQSFVVPSGLAEPALRAGAAVMEITPANAMPRPGEAALPVYLAGFGQNRTAQGVHDSLYARALVLREGKTEVALVVLDLIGLSYERVREIRRRVKAVPGDHVIVACTHVHSGPDTIGLWGPSPAKSGVDESYMAFMMDRAAAAVEAAARAARPAKLRMGAAIVPDGFVKNIREPAVQNKTLTAIQIVGDDQKTIATLVNYASHPETMMDQNRLVTADFCGYTLKQVEARLGGVGIYLNGALGGMITPDVRERTFEETKRVGDGVAAAALQALGGTAPAAPSRRLALRCRTLSIPLENPQFQAALAAGLLKGTLQSGSLTTEICRLDLDDAVLVTVPGELLPRPGLALREQIGAPYRLILGLGNDELGYILDPGDFDRDLYRYERSMSVGRQAWPKIQEAVKELLAARL
jgi:Neutral/alkaline non-lysosomal ceramidase, N-terminal